eukprot:7778712-Pyramimonas_sp.AAC.1
MWNILGPLVPGTQGADSPPPRGPDSRRSAARHARQAASEGVGQPLTENTAAPGGRGASEFAAPTTSTPRTNRRRGDSIYSA